MTPKFLIRFFLLLLIPLSLKAGVFEKTLFGNEFYVDYSDIYYIGTGMIFSLTGDPIETFTIDKEESLYSYLLSDMFPPTFFVCEVGAMPIQIAGATLKKFTPSFYSAASYKDLNLIKLISYSFDFPEPWSVAVLFGKVINFQSSAGGKKGKGYAGLLLSYGNLHILNNDLIFDHWSEVEGKIKGDQIGKDLNLSWSFRLGGRYHSHPDIHSILYLAITRDRSDKVEKKLSLVKNTKFTFRTDFIPSTLQLSKISLEVGKKRPIAIAPKIKKKSDFLSDGANNSESQGLLKERVISLGLSVGLGIERNSIYTRSLAQPKGAALAFLLKPIVQF